MNNSNNFNRNQQLSIWTQIISDCQSAKASGTKVKDWLKANNISKDTYYYWYREVKDSYIASAPLEVVPVSESLVSSYDESDSVLCSSTNDSKSIPVNNSTSIKLSFNDI